MAARALLAIALARTTPPPTGVRRCGDFLTAAQAEAIGIHDGSSTYDEDTEEDNPGLGLLCLLSEGTFSVFVGDQYPTIVVSPI